MFNIPSPMYMSQQQQRPYQAMQGGGPQAAPVINPMQQQEPQQNPMAGMAQMGMQKLMTPGNPMGGNAMPGSSPMSGQQPQGQYGPYAPETAAGRAMNGAMPQTWQALQQDMHTPAGAQGFFPSWLTTMFS